VAFSETERSQIRKYLGWSGRFFQTDSRLEQAMNAVSAETEARVREELARCVALDVKIDDCSKRFKAAVVGSITLPGPMELQLLRSQGKQAVGRIASTLGVEVRADTYSGAASRGSNWLTIA
jgi:hypothetical protein